MPKHEPTTIDILEAIHSFSSEVDQKFANINQRFERIDQRFERIENDLRVIKSTMVTKDYLDDKLADLRGDLNVLIRKEDVKLKELVNMLVKKKVITKKEQEKLFTMEPFAQISL